MKIITTSDLHQWIPKWKDLIRVCEEIRPDYVLIAGDLLPKESSFGSQMNFLPHMKSHALKIKDLGCEMILTLGNDDNQNAQQFMELEDANGTWHYVHNKVKSIKGYDFVGMSFVRDHPFGYKYWCRNEYQGQTFIDSVQFCDALKLDEKHKITPIDNYKDFLDKYPSISEYLEELAAKVADVKKSLWLIHDPPFQSGLDQTARGQNVGSKAVLNFIENVQPLITVHGHIHESPVYTNRWYKQIGETYAFQAGQVSQKLHYCVVEIEEDKVVKYNHSIYE